MASDDDEIIQELERILKKSKLSAKDYGKAAIYLDVLHQDTFDDCVIREKYQLLEKRLYAKYEKADFSPSQLAKIKNYASADENIKRLQGEIYELEVDACYRVHLLELILRRLDVMLLDRESVLYEAVFYGEKVTPPDRKASNGAVTKTYFKVAGNLLNNTLNKASNLIRKQRAYQIYFDLLKEVFDLPVIHLQTQKIFIRNAIRSTKDALEDVSRRQELALQVDGQDALDVLMKYLDTEAEDLPEDFRGRVKEEIKAESETGTFWGTLFDIREEVKRIHGKQ